MVKGQRWTAEQKEYLAKIVRGRAHAEIAELFNSHFNLNTSFGIIKSAIARYKLTTGRTGRFEKGQVSWNKGVKGTHFSPATEFKKGQTPINHRPVGSTRIDKDGYTLIKTKEPRKWEFLHRVIWRGGARRDSKRLRFGFFRR